MKKALISFLAGFSVIFLMALTTDQIIQKVYDSDNTALRVNVVTGGSSGSVTSVGLTMPGGFSVAGSPVTSSGTLAVTANGTSGGVPYYSASNTMASSGALTATALVVGGGAGAAPSSFAVTDNTVPVGNGTISQAKAIPDCTDTGGNHLNYTDSTNAFSCGTSGGISSVTIPYLAGSTANVTNTTSYISMTGGGQAIDTSGNNYSLMSNVTGTLQHMVCRTYGAALTTTQTWTITLEEAAGGATGLTCQINSTSTCPTYFVGSQTGRCCEDTTHTKVIAGKDGYAYKWVPANTPNLGAITCGVDLVVP